MQLVIFLIAWLAALELLTRLFLTTPAAIVPDSEVGWRAEPNQETIIFKADSGPVRVRTNSLGFNDGEPGPKGNRKRILMLGDSYLLGDSVPRAQNFVSLAARTSGYQLINTGRGGLNPATELSTFDDLAPRLRPDGVVMVLGDEDVVDLLTDHITVRRCGKEQKICDARRERSSRNVVLLNLRPLMATSGLITYLMRRYEYLFDARAFNALARFFRPERTAMPGDSGRLRTSDLTEYLRYAFARISARRPLMIVYLGLPVYGPRKLTLPRDVSAKMMMAKAASEAGVVFVDTEAALVKDYANTGVPADGFYFNRPGVGHLNEEGNAVVAHVISQALRTTGFPNKR